MHVCQVEHLYCSREALTRHLLAVRGFVYKKYALHRNHLAEARHRVQTATVERSRLRRRRLQSWPRPERGVCADGESCSSRGQGCSEGMPDTRKQFGRQALLCSQAKAKRLQELEAKAASRREAPSPDGVHGNPFLFARPKLAGGQTQMGTGKPKGKT